MAPGVQFLRCARQLRARPGCHLTTLFGTDSHIVSAIDVPAPAAKKHGWLPLLTVLFLISYGLMTMLIVEQGQTIESQRALIRELFRDSSELSAARMKAAQERAESLSTKTQIPLTQVPQNQAPLTQNPSSQMPSTQYPTTQYPTTQYPSAQAPTRQTPSSQAGPQNRAQSQSAKQKPDFRMPSKPTLDLVDDCRTLITI